MNNLSWFLYLAEVIPNLSSFVFHISWLVLIALFIRNMAVGSENYPFQGVMEGKVNARYDVAVACFVAMALSILFPSKETIYLIAGSEVGEAVVTSEEGKEILNDIHQVIKHQLDTLKGEGK